MSNAADKKAILKNLVEQGKAKGMLSQKEIMDAYEETDITTEQYEKVVETLEALHIEIVDKFFDEILDESELLDEESTAILKSDNLEKALSQEGIAVDDPVKIYLKEIERVPLLSNDEEQELARRMEDNTLLEVLHRQPVKAGDLLFLPAGTIHAICGGVLIAEIQQNSNTTYRVYDYGRLGADGKPRALHVEKALEVISIQKPAPLASPLVETSPTGNQRRHLARCPYFDAHWLRVQETMTLDSGADSFCSLLFLEGQGRLQWQGGVLPFSKGDSFFVPAGLGRFTLSGPAVLLATKVGEEG